MFQRLKNCLFLLILVVSCRIKQRFESLQENKPYKSPPSSIRYQKTFVSDPYLTDRITRENNLIHINHKFEKTTKRVKVSVNKKPGYLYTYSKTIKQEENTDSRFNLLNSRIFDRDFDEFGLMKVEVVDKDQKKIPPDSYSFKVIGHYIEFDSPPPRFSVINMTIREKMTTILSEPNLIHDSIYVHTYKPDGEKYNCTSVFINTSKELRIEVPPFDVSNYVITYDLNEELPIERTISIPHAYEDIEDLIIKSEGKPIRFTHQNNLINITDEIYDGENIDILYTLKGDEKLKSNMELPYEPIENELKLKLYNSNDGEINCDSNRITISKKVVSWNCENDYIKKFEITYKYLKRIEQIFTISVDQANEYIWEVYVNNVETTKYVQDDGVFKFRDLPSEAKVDIFYQLKREKNE